MKANPVPGFFEKNPEQEEWLVGKGLMPVHLNEDMIHLDEQQVAAVDGAVAEEPAADQHQEEIQSQCQDEHTTEPRIGILAWF